MSKNRQDYAPLPETVIDELRKSINDVPGLQAMILTGSCARNEESYFEHEGQRELYSDIEFMAVVSDHAAIPALRTRVEELNRRLKPCFHSPVFEVGCGYIKEETLFRLDKRLIIFELAACGRVVFGDERILERLPVITHRNINRSNLVSILNQRLYHVIREWPDLSEHQKKYAIARNTLDIPTVVLPFFGKLLATYKRRNIEMKQYAACFPEGFCERMDACCDMKLNSGSRFYDEMELSQALGQFVGDMQSAHDAVRQRNGTGFQRDRHRLVRALFRRNPKELLYEWKRPEKEEALFRDMMKCLKNAAFDKENAAAFGRRMDELYVRR